MSGNPTEDPRADESRVDGTETGREGGFLPAVREDTLALMKPPTGNPMVLGPKIPVPEQSFTALPLFTEEQMKQVRRWTRRHRCSQELELYGMFQRQVREERIWRWRTCQWGMLSQHLRWGDRLSWRTRSRRWPGHHHHCGAWQPEEGSLGDYILEFMAAFTTECMAMELCQAWWWR